MTSIAAAHEVPVPDDGHKVSAYHESLLRSPVFLCMVMFIGSEIMLFRLRRKDGSIDPHSAGTYIDAQGRSRFLSASDFSLTPGKTWTSPVTRSPYPVEWTIRIPFLGVDASVATRLSQQEFAGGNSIAPPYWEGAIDAIGTKQGGPLVASGYLEMTGYSAQRREANRSPAEN